LSLSPTPLPSSAHAQTFCIARFDQPSPCPANSPYVLFSVNSPYVLFISSSAAMSAGGLNYLLHTVANTSLHNPVEPYVASAWNYMTDNYSRFTIAMWISVVLHEVLFYEGSAVLNAHPLLHGAGGVLRSLCARFHCPIPTFHA
jgi:hypothetical protein